MSPFPIVGVGASAGGLEAFTELLRLLPNDTGMAFVLIQHLDPAHTSFLSEALGKSTKMPVRQAVDEEPIEPDHVYVIPPNADIAILHGKLSLFPRKDENRKLHLPVDFFFRSLAQDRGSHAIGVILSGTASDGTEGLKAIKAEDGITFAQAPETAKFGGMPHSAINAGVVDYSLPLHSMAQELIRLSHHPYVASLEEQPRRDDQSTLSKIFVVVRNAVGVDFSEYKAPSFERRLARRMALRQVDDAQRYLAILEKEPDEIRALYDDVLIHVTSFFRDPEVFESLKTDVFPQILEHKDEDLPVRIWVAGCSSGEEVYSIAISLLEFMENTHKTRTIQLFGSDVSEKAIEKARLGTYPDGALRELSEPRRRRFFVKTDTGYRINKAVRDLCVFVRHDLARDPPFSRLDLVSCRNVLIYFDQELQKRVLPTFHYALNQPGFLLLGRTENISGFSQMFSPADKVNKIFARTATRSTLWFAPRREAHPVPAERMGVGLAEVPRQANDQSKHLDRMLVARYSPPGVLINEKMEILQFRGETGPYLQPAPGEPQNNLLKMARAGLLSELRATIARAKRDEAPAKTERVEFDQNGTRSICDIEVVPFVGLPETKEHLFVVMFREIVRIKRAAGATSKSKRKRRLEQTERLPKLEHELAATREYLQSLIEDHGRTNDELNSANEELVSGNEELQSMNEELETAKEELQSTNEELTTVNDELHSTNQEMTQVNSDLVNLLSTVDIPILFLDLEQRIRRFTPKARSILNVLPSDIGRDLEDIRVNIEAPDLNNKIREVIDTNMMQESEVQGKDGRWHRMQIRPYKTTDNKIDGATLSLVDIDALKHHVGDEQEARADAERANLAKDQFLAVLSHELRTPLSAILIHSQLLRKEGMDPKVQRAGEVIERGTKVMAQLIEDLLDVSRIVTGKLKMDCRPLDFRAVIRAAIEGVSAQAAKRSIKLESVLSDAVEMVSGDPTRLQQVVSNLLTNSIKFSPPGGQVTLTLDAVNQRARLIVRDNGMGIDAAFLPHVFTRFSQEDGTSTRPHGGLGLGLAIVRHIVEAHGGTVQAASPGTGKGATFSVLLPLLPSLEESTGGLTSSLGIASPEESLHVANRHPRLKGLRVLIVDDDSATREAVLEMMSVVGANARAARSAEEAMPLMDDFRPEMLLCDIAMSEEDGYAFIQKLRARGPNRSGNIPALALTALAGEEDSRRALAAGFQMHLAKPVGIERLLQAMESLLQR